MKHGRSTRSLLATVALMSTVVVGGAVGSGSPLAGAAQTAIGSGLSYAQGVAVDAKGNVFVADTQNGQVDEITPQGVQTTIASGLISPSSVAVDSTGHVYVSDISPAYSGQIQEITPNDSGVYGTPSTVAVSGLYWSVNLAVDASGNLFTADQGTGQIAEYPSTGPGTIGAMITVATTPGGGPSGVTADAAGNLYVTDQWNTQIDQYPSNGSGGFNAPVTVFSVHDAPGWPPPYQFYGLAIDASGNLYVADQQNGQVDELTSNGAGGFNAPVPIGSGQSLVGAVAVDSSGGVYASFGAGISKFTQSLPDVPSGVAAVASNHGASVSWSPMTSYPTLMHFTVTDGQGHTCTTTTTSCAWTGLTNGSVLNFTVVATNSLGDSPPSASVAVTPAPQPPLAASILTTTITGNGSVNVSWNASTEDSTLPITYTVSSTPGSSSCRTAKTSCTVTGLSSGTTYVLNLVATNSSGSSPLTASGPVTPPTQTTIGSGLQNPSGVAIDAAGNVYVSGGSVQKITPAGVQTTTNLPGNSGNLAVDVAGNVYSASVWSGTITKMTPAGVTKLVANLQWPNQPCGIAVDAKGNVFMANCGSDEIDKIAPDGAGGFSALTVLASGLPGPSGLAIDGVGNLYVTCDGPAQVLKITPAGVQTTVGSGFQYPRGVAVDSVGNVYVADLGTGQVVEVTPSGGQPNVSPGVGYPTSVAVDNAGNLFVTDGGSGLLFKFGFRINSSLPAATHGVSYAPVALSVAGVTPSSPGYTTKVQWAVASCGGDDRSEGSGQRGVGSCSRDKSQIPEGMTLSPSGVLSGTPSKRLVPGTYYVNVQVTQFVVTRGDREPSWSAWTISASLPILIK